MIMTMFATSIKFVKLVNMIFLRFLRFLRFLGFLRFLYFRRISGGETSDDSHLTIS